MEIDMELENKRMEMKYKMDHKKKPANIQCVKGYGEVYNIKTYIYCYDCTNEECMTYLKLKKCREDYKKSFYKMSKELKLK